MQKLETLTQGAVAAPTSLPLCVDLDGTLIRTDLLCESLVEGLVTTPWLLFLIPFWLLKGRAYLKDRLAERFNLDASLLPYDQRVVTYVAAEKARGRLVVLATA